MAKACVDKALELFPHLPKSVARNFDTVTTGIRKANAGNAAALNKLLKKARTEFTDGLVWKYQKRIEHNEKKLQLIHHVMQEGFRGKHWDGLLSIIEGTTHNVADAYNSLENITKTTNNELNNRMLFQMRKMNVEKYMQDSANTIEIATAYANINESYKTSDKPAERSAYILAELNTDMLNSQIAAGSKITKDKDWMWGTTHNQDLIFTKTDEWAESMYLNMDAEATWGVEFNVGPKTDVNAHKEKVIAKLHKFAEDIQSVGGGAANFGGNGKRFFKWKSPKAWATYNADFGYNNLVQGVQASIANTSKEIALHSKLGSDPNRMMKEMVKFIEEVDPRGVMVKEKFKIPVGSKADVENALAIFTGKSDRPGDNLWAMGYKAVKYANLTFSLSKLGWTGFASAQDFGTSMLSQKLVAGKTAPDAAASVLKNFMESSGLDKEGRAHMSEMFGVALEGHNRELIEAVGFKYNEDGVSGLMSAALDGLMTLNGTNYITTNFRGGAVMGASYNLNSIINKKSKWSVEETNTINKIGLTTEEIGHLKALQKANNTDTLGFDLLQGSDWETGKVLELKNKLGSYYNHFVASSSPHMNNKQKRELGRHHSQNDKARMLGEMVYLFKGTIASIRNLVAESMRASNPQGDAFTGSAVKSLAETLITLGSVAYVTDKMKEYAKTGTIKESEDPAVFVAEYTKSLINSGAMGIYVGMTLDVYGRRGTRLPAPVVDSGARIFQSLLNGEGGNFQKEAIKIMPFQNLMYWDNAIINLF